MWGSEERRSGGPQSGVGVNADLAVSAAPAMWCNECRFSGVRGDHRCGVPNANFPCPVRLPAMRGSGERLSRWLSKGVGMNADLMVSAVPMDVV